MLKEVYVQGNVKYLKKIYEAYKEIKDEAELIKIAGRIIQSDDEEIDKVYITSLFDEVYTIIASHRKECRDLLELEGNLQLGNDTKKLSYVREYKEKYFEYLGGFILNIVNDIKKAIKNAHGKNKELEAFLQLNYADYNRYLCEVTLNKQKKNVLKEETEKAYQDYFKMCEEANVCLVSTPFMAGHYHYSLFMFEVKEDQDGAIKYLNLQKSRFIDLLDTVFKNFTDSYDILNLITDTLTYWILLANSGNENDIAEDVD
jgi:copper chaperone CopZ